MINKKVTYIPNRMLIKEEIEKGNLACPYAQLVENQNLVIKWAFKNDLCIGRY